MNTNAKVIIIASQVVPLAPWEIPAEAKPGNSPGFSVGRDLNLRA